MSEQVIWATIKNNTVNAQSYVCVSLLCSELQQGNSEHVVVKFYWPSPVVLTWQTFRVTLLSPQGCSDSMFSFHQGQGKRKRDGVWYTTRDISWRTLESGVFASKKKQDNSIRREKHGCCKWGG